MKVFKDIEYIKQADNLQKLDLYLPDSDEFPVFIYFHGGGLEAGSKDENFIFIPKLVKKRGCCSKCKLQNVS